MENSAFSALHQEGPTCDIIEFSLSCNLSIADLLFASILLFCSGVKPRVDGGDDFVGESKGVTLLTYSFSFSQKELFELSGEGVVTFE